MSTKLGQDHCIANALPTAPRAPSTRDLLDEGRDVGSVRTMYRLLAVSGQSRERRHQCVHPAYAKPELLAVQPNEVWSWDITKLKGPLTRSGYHLYRDPR